MSAIDDASPTSSAPVSIGASFHYEVCFLACATFSGKNSTPWAPGSLHDYMHAKATVADDTVFCGSFNLSRSGEHNAEDMLEIHDPELADQLVTFVDAVRARYPRFTLPAEVTPIRSSRGACWRRRSKRG